MHSPPPPHARPLSFRAVHRENWEMGVPLIMHSPHFFPWNDKERKMLGPSNPSACELQSVYQVMLLTVARNLCSTVTTVNNQSSGSLKSFMKNSKVYIHNKKQTALSNTKHESTTALCYRRSLLKKIIIL